MLPLGAETFLSRIVRTMYDGGADDVVVVLGGHADLIAADIAERRLNVRLAPNPDFARGQATSLAAGLRVVDRPGVAAVLVTLVDVPLVAVSTVRAVLTRFRETGAPIVRPVRGGRHGHPLLVARSLFEAIGSADPAVGIKPIVRAHATPAGEVDVDDAGAFLDADTPEDYGTLLERMNTSRR